MPQMRRLVVLGLGAWLATVPSSSEEVSLAAKSGSSTGGSDSRCNAAYNSNSRDAAACAQERCLAQTRVEISRCPDKDEMIVTISKQFKLDIAEYFCARGAADLTVLELGIFRGHTTGVLAAAFSKVLSVDVESQYLRASAAWVGDRKNVVWLQMDTFADDWHVLRSNKIDVVIIDADHKYEKVLADARHSLEYLTPCEYLVFDDYGVEEGVQRAVTELVEVNALKDCVPLGRGKEGPWFLKTWGRVNRSEGVLCRRGPASQVNAKTSFTDVAYLVYAQPSDPLMRSAGVFRFTADGGMWSSNSGRGAWRPQNPPEQDISTKSPRDALEMELPHLDENVLLWDVLFNRPRTAFVLSPARKQHGSEGNSEVRWFGLRADKLNHVFQIANYQFDGVGEIGTR